MLAKVNRYTIVDAGFAVDLGRFAGAAFLDKGIVLAVGENKSFVVLDPSDKADAERELPLLPRVVRHSSRSGRGRGSARCARG